jgi:hypothetical protein
MATVLHSVVHVDVATGTEFGGEWTPCSYPSAAEAWTKLKARDLKLVFFDGYALDFSSVGHLGLLRRVEFKDAA